MITHVSQFHPVSNAYPCGVALILKPSMKLASKLTDNDLRRCAVIQAETGRRPLILTAAKGKSRLFEPHEDELAGALRHALVLGRSTAHAVKMINDHRRGRLDLADLSLIYPPRDLNSYLWTDEMREAAKTIWRSDMPTLSEVLPLSWAKFTALDVKQSEKGYEALLSALHSRERIVSI